MKSGINFLLLTLLAISSIQAQQWKLVTQEIPVLGRKDIQPDKDYKYYVDDAEMKSILWTAPHESTTHSRQSNCVITVPLANGEFDQFSIVQYDMMESELAAKYKDIRTFYGFSKTNPYRKIRADYTNYGFRAVIKDKENPNTYIDHYQRNDRGHKIVYYKKDLQNIHQWSCSFDELEENHHEERPEENNNRAGDCTFRQYRLAQATTAEYSNFHGAFSVAQEALVMSAVVLVVNRCNGVYEEDFTLRTVLVSNTDDLFYYNASSDPYTNDDGGTMLGENQTTCDNIIGSANYDIGHVYSTGGGGVAYLGALCSSSQKAGGVTGQSQPIGDPFSIDYVAHEMGHQFGDQHTQYNNCNRSNASAMEPGSASTIMGYAGICSPNVQNNSDDYFHARSIQQTATEVTGTGGNCFTTIPFVNQAPVVDNVPNYTIPKSTPFVLMATASDADNDPMTYCWEQMNAFSNPAQTMPPASTNTTGPIFRSLDDVISPSRYFPSIDNIVNGTADTWEVLPSVGRSLAFRVTVRDYHTIAGCTDEDDVTVTVNGTAGPFLVSSFNTASSWFEGDSKTITWDVAGTTANSINCANVDIFLSTDGGYTYPITLATATPNDGTHVITVPGNINTTQGRFMVRGSGNIFFDVNNANLIIAPQPNTFDLSLTPNIGSICNTDTFTTTVNVLSVGGFTNPVTLSVTNALPGSTVMFSSNPVIPGNAVTLKMYNFAPNTGNFNFTINGFASPINKQTTLNLTVQGTIAAPNLLTPANNATGISVIPTLTWSSVSGASSYKYQLSRSNTFSYLSNEGSIAVTTVKVNDGVEGSSQLFWRVKSVNSCENLNSWSSPFSFNTEACFYLDSDNVPITIPTTTTTVFSNNKSYYRTKVNDVDVINLKGNHTFVDDLKFSLVDPANVEYLFFDRPCNGEDNFHVSFSNTAAGSNFPCPPVDSATYLPANPLPKKADTYGLWKLKIEDVTGGNGGDLQNWGIKGCYTEICKLLVDHPYSSGLGSLEGALSCAVNGDTIFIADELNGQNIDLGTSNMIINKNLVIKTNTGMSVTVISNASNPTLIVNNGFTLSLEGININGSQSTNAAAVNNGTLNLKNLNVVQNASIPLQKNLVNNGALKIEGQCNLSN